MLTVVGQRLAGLLARAAGKLIPLADALKAKIDDPAVYYKGKTVRVVSGGVAASALRLIRLAKRPGRF
jgi:hypothetical protein